MITQPTAVENGPERLRSSENSGNGFIEDSLSTSGTGNGRMPSEISSRKRLHPIVIHPQDRPPLTAKTVSGVSINLTGSVADGTVKVAKLAILSSATVWISYSPNAGVICAAVVAVVVSHVAMHLACNRQLSAGLSNEESSSSTLLNIGGALSSMISFFLDLLRWGK